PAASTIGIGGTEATLTSGLRRPARWESPGGGGDGEGHVGRRCADRREDVGGCREGCHGELSPLLELRRSVCGVDRWGGRVHAQQRDDGEGVGGGDGSCPHGPALEECGGGAVVAGQHEVVSPVVADDERESVVFGVLIGR